MEHKKFVVIEKDKILKSILELFIEQLEYNLLDSFLNFKEALDFIQKNQVDILIIDLNTFDNKVSLKDYIKQIEKLEFPILFIGNSEDIEIAKEMIGLNIYSFMSKPITKNILKINIEIAYSKHRKISYQNQQNSSTSCSTICQLNTKGEIIKNDNNFQTFFNFTESTFKNISISQIIKSNPDFNDFNTFVKEINLTKNKTSLFEYNSQIYEAHIKQLSEDIFEVCFKTSILENKIFFENQYYKERFNTVFNTTSEAILIFDAQNYLVNYNEIAQQRYKRIIGTDLYTGFTFFEILKFIPRHELENILETVHIPTIHKLKRTISNNRQDFNLELQIAPISSKSISSINGYIVSSVEVTKEINLQNEITTLKDELKPVYESTIQRFYLIDINKKIVAFNESAFKIIQEEHNHTLQKGDNILQFVPKEIGEEHFEDSFKRVLNGEHITFKTKVNSVIGEYWNEVHYEPVINERGELNRILIWTLDITDSENNLIALNNSNKRYELVAKGGNDGLWDWDLRTNEVYLSPRWKNLLGYDDDELENEFGIRDSLTHPDDRKPSEEQLLKSFKNNEEIFQNEIRLLCKNQKYKWVLERGLILRDNNNKPYRLAGSITDITDRKETEQSLKQLNKSLLEERSMFITGNVGIIRINAQDLTDVSYVSENCEEITGYSSYEFYNKNVPFRDLIHPEDRDFHKKERKIAFDKKLNHIDYSDYRIVKKDGSIIWVKDFTTIIRNSKGEVTNLLGYFIDITKSKLTEIESESIQNMFSALWQSVTTETFVINTSGKILFSRNNSKFSMKKLLEKDYYIFDYYENLFKWSEIQKTVSVEQEEYSTTIKINNTDYQIKISLIDSDKFLVSTNIPF